MFGATEDTPSNYIVQDPLNEKVHDPCAGTLKGRESGAMAREENEGLRLDQVLAAHGLNRAKLAKRLNLAPSTIQKWRDSLSRGDMKPGSWNSCARALSAVGIDPKEVRPSAEVPTKTNVATLIPPLMAIADRRTLELMQAFLELDDPSDREALLAIVRVKLQ